MATECAARPRPVSLLKELTLRKTFDPYLAREINAMTLDLEAMAANPHPLAKLVKSLDFELPPFGVASAAPRETGVFVRTSSGNWGRVRNYQMFLWYRRQSLDDIQNLWYGNGVGVPPWAQTEFNERQQTLPRAQRIGRRRPLPDYHDWTVLLDRGF